MDPQIPHQASPPVTEENTKQATPKQTREELRQAIYGSNDVLARATTTLTLFPDTIVLDRAKLTVTKRTFVRVAEVMSIRIEDILNITASVGPIFGKLTVSSRVMTSGPYTIGRFWREEAIRLKRIVQGYVIALQREIDCSALPTHELAIMLDKLGEDDHPASQS